MAGSTPHDTPNDDDIDISGRETKVLWVPLRIGCGKGWDLNEALRRAMTRGHNASHCASQSLNKCELGELREKTGFL